MCLRTLLLAAVLAAAPVTALATVEAAWRALPPALPADSCVTRLRRWEGSPPSGLASADVSMALGQLHYARGEYRQAREAFARAAAKHMSEARGDARYWVGLASLALSEGSEARDAFTEAAALSPERRPLARLGYAQAWDVERRPEKSFDALHVLLAEDAGEAGAPALERLATLAEQFKRNDEARRARQRLAREYPKSPEAGRVSATPAAAPGSGPVGVQIGVFADRDRATALAARARGAGFNAVQVVEKRGEGARPTLWVVRLGRYASREEADAAGERAQHELGVGWQVMAP